jgi:anti-sigma regulatory factor (Ser/Thr protein kinase)
MQLSLSSDDWSRSPVGRNLQVTNLLAIARQVPGDFRAQHKAAALFPSPPPAGPQLVAEWPLQTFLELGALAGAVPCARLHARQVVWEWGMTALADTVELALSELVTNAVRASTGLLASRYAGRWTAGLPPVRLWLYSDRRRILIQVWDGDHKMPARQEAGPDAESGRGLLLLESISADWGSYILGRSSGKVVWAAVTGVDSRPANADIHDHQHP